MKSEKVDSEISAVIDRAARLIGAADAIIATAGAGIGVESGLPAFRGESGFAASYPLLANQNLQYEDLASPAIFERNPHLAWGFHAHCANLYQRALPHAGFAVLKKWFDAAPLGGFVYTSNIDGQFQKAGFDPSRILECHGSSSRVQCSAPCSDHTWDFSKIALRYDPAAMRTHDPLPACPRCGGLARPNIRFFNDAQWIGRQTAIQSKAFERWKGSAVGRSVVIVECGAGTMVPAVRIAGDWAIQQLGATLIRINPIEAEVPSGHLSIALGAREALLGLSRPLCSTPDD